MEKREALHTSVFHSLEEQMWVVNQAGIIVDVNWAWENFGAENGRSSEYSCPGYSYLTVDRACEP